MGENAGFFLDASCSPETEVVFICNLPFFICRWSRAGVVSCHRVEGLGMHGGSAGCAVTTVDYFRPYVTTHHHPTSHPNHHHQVWPPTEFFSVFFFVKRVMDSPGRQTSNPSLGLICTLLFFVATLLSRSQTLDRLFELTTYIASGTLKIKGHQ